MPRLSEPMRWALEAASGEYLCCTFGMWRGANSDAWFTDRTIRALEARGLLRRDGPHYVITQEGRVAIFTILPKAGREASGMKEGEDA